MRTKRLKLNPLRRLLACRNGATAVEFALALPVVALTFAGLLELAMIMFVSVLAEGGLREAARFGQTGGSPTGVTREARIEQIIEEHTYGLIDVSPSDITIKAYDVIEDVGQPETIDNDVDGDGVYDESDGDTFIDANGNGVYDLDKGTPGAGETEDIVVYELDFEWDLLTPLISSLIGTDGKIDMEAVITVPNEPFAPVE